MRYSVTVTMNGTDMVLNRQFRTFTFANRWANKFRVVPVYTVTFS